MRALIAVYVISMLLIAVWTSFFTKVKAENSNSEITPSAVRFLHLISFIPGFNTLWALILYIITYFLLRSGHGQLKVEPTVNLGFSITYFNKSVVVFMPIFGAICFDWEEEEE